LDLREATIVEPLLASEDRLHRRLHVVVDKGQVENQVGLVRERFFTPRLRCKNLDELNAWLLDRCIAYTKAHRHPELSDQTIWEVFEAERPKLVPYPGRFDGFHAVPAFHRACGRKHSAGRHAFRAGLKACSSWKGVIISQNTSQASAMFDN
jgi:hypothetical protein